VSEVSKLAFPSCCLVPGTVFQHPIPETDVLLPSVIVLPVRVFPIHPTVPQCVSKL